MPTNALVNGMLTTLLFALVRMLVEAHVARRAIVTTVVGTFVVGQPGGHRAARL